MTVQVNRHFRIILNQIRDKYRKLFAEYCLTLSGKKAWREYYDANQLGVEEELTQKFYDEHIGEFIPACLGDKDSGGAHMSSCCFLNLVGFLLHGGL